MEERTRSDRARAGSSGRSASRPRSEGGSNARRELGAKARKKGAEIRTRAVDVIEQNATRRMEGAADQLADIVNVLRNVGDALGAAGLSEYPNNVADRVEQLADRLRESEPRELVQEIEELARRYPELFIGGVLLAGVATGRFLRASARAAGEAPPAAGTSRAKGGRKPGAGLADAPNYSGSRDYDEAEDGQYAPMRGGSADPGAGVNYASDRDYADAGESAGDSPARKRKASGSKVASKPRVPKTVRPMPGGGRTAKE